MPLTKNQLVSALAMWNDGKTGGMIAAEFRVTRSSIMAHVGRWRRAGLAIAHDKDTPERPQINPSQTRARRPRTTTKISPAPARPLPAPIVAPEAKPALGAGPAIMALKPHDCRWPIGETDAADFHFCCAPVHPGPAEQPPYCMHHLGRALSDERARRRFGVTQAEAP